MKVGMLKFLDCPEKNQKNVGTYQKKSKFLDVSALTDGENGTIIKISGDNSAGWSSLEARRAHNPKAAGSNPAPAIFNTLYSFHVRWECREHFFCLRSDLVCAINCADQMRTQ